MYLEAGSRDMGVTSDGHFAGRKLKLENQWSAMATLRQVSIAASELQWS